MLLHLKVLNERSEFIFEIYRIRSVAVISHLMELITEILRRR